MRETEIVLTLNAVIDLLRQEIRYLKERRMQDLIRLLEKKEKLGGNFTRVKEILKTDGSFGQGFTEQVYHLNRQLNQLGQESQSYYEVALKLNHRILMDLSKKILSGTRLKEQYNQQAKIKFDNIHRPVSLSLNEES